MAKDDRQKQNDELLTHLFGDAENMSDEEIDLLYEVLAEGDQPSKAVYAIAEAAAVEFRKLGKVPPDHIQAALAATRQPRTLDNAKLASLKRVVEMLGQPFSGPVGDPAFSYRGLKEISEKDKRTLDDLAKELEEDWDQEGQ